MLACLICSGTLALSGLRGLVGGALWAADDPRDIVRRALDRNTHNSEELERNYTYTERNERRILDGFLTRRKWLPHTVTRIAMAYSYCL